jgi:hypothetical protein
LLIDVWPGVMNDLVIQARHQLYGLLASSGFKEIWLVGLVKEYIYQLWPKIQS